MHYATLVKVAQQFTTKDSTVKRIAKLKIRSNGFIRLNDGTNIAVHPRDVGRSVLIETDIRTKEQSISFD